MAQRPRTQEEASPLRSLPSVDQALQDPRIRALEAAVGRELLAELVRGALARRRESIRSATRDRDASSGGDAATIVGDVHASLASDVEAAVARERRAGIRRAINATGVVLHTGLGRAPVHAEAARAMAEVAGGYCVLEVDRESGERNERDHRLSTLVARALGCEAAIAVNNNAAATMLVLAAFSRGRETILSRGELVEIGGSFRMPDVMASAGAILREVGTTNRTRVADYRDAIGESTGLLLKVHTSNYRVQGFVEEVSARELAALARERSLPSAYDLGSGRVELDGLSRLDALGDEPIVRDAVESGVDVVTFSGDKLLGGPQAGVLCGKRSAIAKLRKSPLYRAVRLDKVAVAGLERTFELLLAGRGDEIPARRMLLADPAALRESARRIAGALSALAGVSAEVVDALSQPGSGSAPGVFLPTSAVRVTHARFSADALDARLRSGEPPVFARIHDGALLLDPRTLLDGDEQRLVEAFSR